MIVLHDDALSAECYAVRLFASMLGVPLETHAVDLIAAPGSDVPVLVDDSGEVRETTAILRRLASTHDVSGRWSPAVGEIGASCATWLHASNDLRESAGAARRFKTLSVAADIDACQTNAHALLRHLDRHLWFEEDERAGWLCPAPHPTIADIACFPHVMLAPEGGISFLEYPAVRRWTHRVKKIPGFIPMPGIFPA